MLWIWLGFICFILLMLALDLGVFHRKAHVVSMREALAWSAVWISLGLLFGVFVYFGYENHWLGLGQGVDLVDGKVNDGSSATLKYFTGYIVEKSLSVDNVFVIAMIFGAFAVPAIYQHRVLFWGILGALIMRGAMIAIGAQLIAHFHWVLYVFGLFLVITGIKMLFIQEQSDPRDNAIVKFLRKRLPITDAYHGQQFVLRAGDASVQGEDDHQTAVKDEAVARQILKSPGSLMLTPLLLALIVVEVTDVIFAIDSIPAIFAITGDPFLVFTSNAFAILGLRSLYFALAGMMQSFKYLKTSLAAVLVLVGGKMLGAHWLKQFLGPQFNLYLMGGVLLILGTGLFASFLSNRKNALVASADVGV